MSIIIQNVFAAIGFDYSFYYVLAGVKSLINNVNFVIYIFG